MARALRFATLDVFTRTRFEGNPLAIVHLPADAALTPAEKQAIAREFNLSETVFLHPLAAPGEAERRLDIFLPIVEIPFAGHPVIGALCHIAAAEHPGESRDIRLRVKAGLISAQIDGPTSRASAEIPHDVHVHTESLPRSQLAAAQPAMHAALGDAPDAPDAPTTFPVVSIVRGMAFALVELPALAPHLAAVGPTRHALPDSTHPADADWPGPRGCLYFVRVPSPPATDGAEVASAGDTAPAPQRLRTRMVSAHVGEDAATGSASCALAAHLALTEGGAPGTEYAFELEQGVEMGRRSCIAVRVTLDGTGRGVARVALAGQSVLVQEGVIWV